MFCPNKTNYFRTETLILSAYLLFGLCNGQDSKIQCCTDYECLRKENCSSVNDGCGTLRFNNEMTKHGCISHELESCYKDQGLIPEKGKCVEYQFSSIQVEQFMQCKRDISAVEARVYIELQANDEDLRPSWRNEASQFQLSRKKRSEEYILKQAEKDRTLIVLANVCICKGNLCHIDSDTSTRNNKTASLVCNKDAIFRTLLFVFASGVILLMN